MGGFSRCEISRPLATGALSSLSLKPALDWDGFQPNKKRLRDAVCGRPEMRPAEQR